MASLLGVAFGLGLGTIAGLSVGPQVFPRILKPKDLSCLDEAADHNEEVEVPEPGTKIGADMRRLLDFTEPWTTLPDYQRVSMINRILKILWPSLTKGIMDMVLVKAKEELQKHVFSNPKLGFIEDIVLGTDAMRPDGVQDFSKWVKGKQFTVGSIPPRIGGIKLYDTSEDEVILEVPLLFGSNIKMHIGVFIRAGPVRLYVPVELSDIHLKGDARITLKPLVDTIPCIGGAMVSLLSVPHVDFTLKLFGGVDLMALPILKDCIRQTTKMVLESMLVQPNCLTFPIMPNFGLLPPAKGAISVTLLRGERLKDLPLYIEVEIRKGRTQYTETLLPREGRLDINQNFNLIVDDYELQTLKVRVYKDDSGWSEVLLGQGEIKFGEYEEEEEVELEEGQEKPPRNFKEAEFIKTPLQEQLMEVKLSKPKQAKGMVAAGAGAVVAAPGQALSGAKTLTRGIQRLLTGKSKSMAVAADAAVAGGASSIAVPEKDRGSIYLKVMFMSFFQPIYDDEDDADIADLPEATGLSNVAPPPAKAGVQEAGAAPSTIKPTKSVKAKKKSAVSMPSVRQVTTKVPDKLKGVLTVTLVRCINLNGDDVNSYVRFLVSDDDQDMVQKSHTVYSQNSPRWGHKFDFVMVTAGSSLFMTVYGKRGITGNVLGAVNPLNIFGKKKTDEEADKVLGKLEIRVRDVARNGTIKDTWTLQDAEKGQIELVLQWQTCYIND